MTPAVSFDATLRGELTQLRSALCLELCTYLDALAREVSRLPAYLPALGLSSIHRRARVTTQPPSLAERRALEDQLWRGAPDRVESEQEPRPWTVDWDEASRRRYRRVVLLGGPGLGKSTHCHFEAYRLTSQARALRDASLGLAQVELPLLLRLPLLAKDLEEHGGDVLGALPRVCVALSGAPTSPALVRFLERRLLAGKALVLLDGWDEIPANHRDETLQNKLATFVNRHPLASVCLTSRGVGYEPAPSFAPRARQSPTQRQAHAFEIMELRPFADDDIRGFVGAWFAASGGAPLATAKLLGEIRDRSVLRDLARSPLLLAFLCSIAFDDPTTTLPSLESDVYRLVLKLLFTHALRRRPGLFEPRTLRKALGALSVRLMDQGGANGMERPSFSDDELHELHEPLEAQLAERAGGTTVAEELAPALKEAGLFVTADAHPGRYTLSHRTLMEYFAAMALAEAEPCGTSDPVASATERLFEWVSLGGTELIQRAIAPSWQRSVAFLAGVHACGVDPDRIANEPPRTHALASYLRALRRAGHPREGFLHGLAARSVAECQRACPHEAELATLADEVARELLERFEVPHANSVVRRHWPLADRLFALEQLGRLGDPRLSDRSMWVAVPVEEFVMGTNEGVLDAAPPHTVRLGAACRGGDRAGAGSAFLVGWRPVTVSDFERFVEQGYGKLAFWSFGRSEDDGDAPVEWETQRNGPKNVPVTNVSWFAASAFAQWLTETEDLPRCPLCHRTTRASLPSEAEWEFVASGGGRRKYPWGNDEPCEGDGARANYGFEGAPAGVTPVGAFPLGHTPSAETSVVDLAGNVFEWCLDVFRDRDDPSWVLDGANPCFSRGDVDAPRVLRGGSCNELSAYLRVQSRHKSPPWYASKHQGFRLVCRCPGDHA